MQRGGRASLVTPLRGQTDGVAHPGSQVGQDVARRRGRDLLLLHLAVSGDVHQPVAAHLGLRFPPSQSERGLRGLGFF